MKRFEKSHAHVVARRFAGSRSARIFYEFTSSIRRALIDSFVMDEIRMATTVGDSVVTFTAAEIVEFIDEVRRCLAAGVVPEGRRSQKCTYEVQS